MPSSTHERLCDLAHSQCRLDVSLGDALLAAYRESCHVALGLGSFREYAERYLGWTGRQTEERLRVALALESLPGLRAALSEGTLLWSAVREISRVATAETEREWIAAADRRTAREVERMVSCRELGDRPSDPPKAEATRHRLSLSLSAQAMAAWQHARDEVARQHGGRVDDDALVLALATGALSGNRDAGTSSYQITLSVCERCQHAEQVAGSHSVTVEAAAAEAARCDATIVTGRRASQTIPPRVRREVLARGKHRCAVPGCGHSAWVEVHHVTPRSEGGTHDPEGLVPLCSAHHTHVHEGRLVAQGSAREGFRFEHADGTEYGAREASPERSAARATALSVLVELGFKTAQAQAMLRSVSPHVGARSSADGAGEEGSVEALVRAALRRAEAPRVSGVREPAVEYETAA